MAKKKYDYNKQNNVTFVNPYNFIHTPKSNQERPAHNDAQDGEKLTGVLHCVLQTRTPLAILDTTLMTKQGEHQVYPFYRLNGVPTIPGSSIRGCVRNLYETVTKSCYVTLSDEEFVSARVDAKSPYLPGVLKFEGNEWKLYPANRISVVVSPGRNKQNPVASIEIDNNERVMKYRGEVFKYGDEVEYTGSPSSGATSMKHAKNTNCYVYVGEPIFSKNKESIFEISGKAISGIETSTMNRAINGLKYSIEMYRDDAVNRNYDSSNKGHHGYAGFERAKEQGTIPVWYKGSGDDFSLSMAAIGRKVYPDTVNMMLGKYYEPCRSRRNACPACRTFGMIKGGSGESLGSRVRFMDAIAVEGAYQMEKSISLKELGSPRAGYYPFYALNGDKDYAEINGRKFYWHIPDASKNKAVYVKGPGEKNDKRNATVEVAKEANFTFDVFFEELSADELETLKWVLTCGENEKDSKYCLKLGHGKPLGLGSVKITIDSEMRRHYDGQGYHSENIEHPSVSAKTQLLDEKLAKDVQTICDFELMKGENVCYPFIVADDVEGIKREDSNAVASHQWFTSNKGRSKYSDAPMILKGVSDKPAEHRLPVYKAVEREDNHGGGNHWNGGGNNRNGGGYNRNGGHNNNRGRNNQGRH